MAKRELCYCKHCDTTFSIQIQQFENRALLLECPTCRWHHPRQFEAGVAIHCELNRMENPVLVKG